MMTWKAAKKLERLSTQQHQSQINLEECDRSLASSAVQPPTAAPKAKRRHRDTHGGFLEHGVHYFLAPSWNASITWDVAKIRAELHKRGLATRGIK